MGACSGGGTFIDSSWRRGIEIIQEEAEREYGHREGYSGAPNSCNFFFAGEKPEFAKDTKKAKKDLNDFIDKHMDRLGTGEGEVISLGIEYYGIISTEITEEIWAGFDSRYYLKSAKKGPAVLLMPYDRSNSHLRIIAEGTVADLKKIVHKELRNKKYETNFYIVSKTKTYLCTGKIKQQKKTQRQTDDKVLVLPFYKFMYYGWYRE